jgi:aryl-alcohol dehydrogenase-like predicted oxidoreductase
LTLSGPESAATLVRALAASAGGERVFDTVQATFNCLEPSLAAPLARAHDAGVGVIVKEAFANGRLSDANARPEDAPLVADLRGAAARLGCGIDQLALAFVLEQPFVDVVLSGAATRAQLGSHVGALDVRLDEPARRILAGLAEPTACYWRTRGTLAWS